MMLNKTTRSRVVCTRESFAQPVIIITLILICACGVRLSHAETIQLTDNDAVQSGRDALRKRASFPWYDSNADSLRPITTKPHREVDARNRSSNWENNWTFPQSPNFNFPTWTANVFQYLIIAVLVAALITLLVFVVRAFLKTEMGTHVRGGKKSSDELLVGDVSRIENLPFELQAPHGDLLAEARRLYEQGNYRLAIVYLFSHQLLFLDRHQLIRLAKGKTNRQYLREVRRKVPTVKQAVERTMIAFEDVFFGDHPLDQKRFESCWIELDEFHSRVEEVTA